MNGVAERGLELEKVERRRAFSLLQRA